MNIFLGRLNLVKSRDGKTEYFKGMFQNMPVLGFYSKKDPTVLDVILDTTQVARLSGQKKKEFSNPKKS
ncbi:MAG: hypothetical protein M1501_00625 [Candidatus Omnitrophica bacterium]|nr:hypothetical protein [Candidatus Omnitrophota bacterium]